MGADICVETVIIQKHSLWENMPNKIILIIELKLCSSGPSLVYVQLCAHGHDTGEYLQVGQLKNI